MSKYPSIDHKGREYSCFSVMCQHYSISPTTVLRRLNHGWDIQRALCTPREFNEYTKKPKPSVGAEFGMTEAQYLHHLSDRLQRSEYILALNNDIKKIAKTIMSQLRDAKDKNEMAYGLWLPYGGYNESVTCLLNLYLKLRSRKEIKVFNNAEIALKGEPMRIFCTKDFLDLFDGAEGMKEILRYLMRFGIHLYIKEEDFFLGYHDWGRLHFTKKRIDLYQKIF